MSNNLPPLIVLAGGKSERMGAPKGLLPFFGKVWLFEQLDAYRRAGGKKAVVVLGYKSQDYLNETTGLSLEKPLFRGSLEISAIINNFPEHGPFSTIQAGLKFFNTSPTGAFFLALDKPAPSPDIWMKLATSDARMAYPVRFGHDGHPVYISADFSDKIIRMNPENKRMNQLRNELDDGQRLEIESDETNVGLNLNTPADWEGFIKSSSPFTPENLAITGRVRSGKTTRFREKITLLQQTGIKVGGVFQPEENGAYFVEDVRTGERMLLAQRIKEEIDGLNFRFDPKAWEFARDTILKARRECDILAVDEIGRLESQGKGHVSSILQEIPNETILCRLLSVRTDCFDRIAKIFPSVTVI